MTIGDFARATRLSAKALRFYHQVGLLEPAEVGAVNGYRLYAAEQIVTAQIIRQLRSLEVPVDTIREILRADVAARNALIADHLERLEARLEATRSAVLSLRGLLSEPSAERQVEHRSVPPMPVLAIRETIELSELGPWYDAAMSELDAAIDACGAEAAGPRGGIWDTRLVLDERGEATVFTPVATLEGLDDATIGPTRARAELLPAVELAIVAHRGPDATMAQTYGRLGAYVAEHEMGVDGPIRETYLGTVTEVGWPIFRTAR
jgi:DNA-binding transcriptional MerR regulator